MLKTAILSLRKRNQWQFKLSYFIEDAAKDAFFQARTDQTGDAGWKVAARNQTFVSV